MPADIASFALAGALVVSPHCQWSSPGADRFTGALTEAVDHYADLPTATRERLKAKLASHAYDDRVVITRKGVQGHKQAYAPQIRDMHFGSNRVCRNVKVDKWPARRKVEALVYCDSGHCLMVPSACGNLSRVALAPSDEPLDITPAAGPAAATPAVSAGPTGQAGPAGLLGGMPSSGSAQGGPAAGATPAPAPQPTPAQGDPGVVVAQAPQPPQRADPPSTQPTRGEPPWPPSYPVRPGDPPYSISVLVPAPVSPVLPVVPEAPAWMLGLLGLPLVALALAWRRHQDGKQRGKDARPS